MRRSARRHLYRTDGPADELYTSYRTENRLRMNSAASPRSSFKQAIRASRCAFGGRVARFSEPVVIVRPSVLRLISSSEFWWAASIMRESIDEYGRHTPRSSRHCHCTASWMVGWGRSSRASTENIPSVGRRGISSPIRHVISYSSEGLRGTSSTSAVTGSAEPVSR
uniref:Uncharacterized protein n=1 Tax=Anopheles atroparvus TaxID=41427 RepID=A0A182JFI2_ANOAO